MVELFANCGDSEQMPHSENVASDLGLHCLPITILVVSRLKWVRVTLVLFYNKTCLMDTHKNSISEVYLMSNGTHSKKYKLQNKQKLLMNMVNVLKIPNIFLQTFFFGLFVYFFFFFLFLFCFCFFVFVFFLYAFVSQSTSLNGCVDFAVCSFRSSLI